MSASGEHMRIERGHPYFGADYLSFGNWSDSRVDSIRLLDASEDLADETYYFDYRPRGYDKYLARQIFLRSYQFCLEETFKDKVKKALGKLKQVAKTVIDGQYERFLARKFKEKMKFWPRSCIRPSFVLESSSS